MSSLDPGLGGYPLSVSDGRPSDRVLKLSVRLLLFFLEPLSIAYWATVTIRGHLYAKGSLKSYRPPCKAICVGNLTTGGSGKTPAVILVCQLLLEMGKKPAVISRGYGRSSRAVEVLGPSDSPAPRSIDVLRRFGDEVLLINSRLPEVPIVVSGDRAGAARAAAQRFSPDVLVMDDGFGHLRLQRDLNILMFDARHPFGNRRLLPCGTLREPVSAIERAGIAILSRSDRCDPDSLTALEAELHKHNERIVVFRSAHRPKDLERLSDGCRLELPYISGKRVLAFCGIARPHSFFSSLSELGAHVTPLPYPDHHTYSPRELEALLRQLDSGSHDLLVTTEKDVPRLVHIPPEAAEKIFLLRIELTLSDAEGVASAREMLRDEIAGRIG
ncbi:MAG: tetraacyldisaccharide 4'-kinase [Candidatus Coatesbacteria bacterium]|nr:tetraacyldisaccharide 4'-kinase [Candidatus Coatesbacteria bacterium]